MFSRSSSGGLDGATKALAAAAGIAHLAFLSVFGWRAFAGGMFARFYNLFFAALAALGFALSAGGAALVKYGGRTRLRRYGLWAIAASTALAGGLLFVASWTGS
jgi:hypothetical protein